MKLPDPPGPGFGIHDPSLQQMIVSRGNEAIRASTSKSAFLRFEAADDPLFLLLCLPGIVGVRCGDDHESLRLMVDCDEVVIDRSSSKGDSRVFVLKSHRSGSSFHSRLLVKQTTAISHPPLPLPIHCLVMPLLETAVGYALTAFWGVVGPLVLFSVLFGTRPPPPRPSWYCSHPECAGKSWHYMSICPLCLSRDTMKSVN